LLKELKVRARSFFPKSNQDRPKGIIRDEIGVLSMISVLDDGCNKDLDFSALGSRLSALGSRQSAGLGFHLALLKVEGC
jgi:hypothetical protein